MVDRKMGDGLDLVGRLWFADPCYIPLSGHDILGGFLNALASYS